MKKGFVLTIDSVMAVSLIVGALSFMLFYYSAIELSTQNIESIKSETMDRSMAWFYVPEKDSLEGYHVDWRVTGQFTGGKKFYYCDFNVNYDPELGGLSKQAAQQYIDWSTDKFQTRICKGVE